LQKSQIISFAYANFEIGFSCNPVTFTAMKLLKIFIVLAILSLSRSSQGQVKFNLDILAGPNYNWVRNNVLFGERPAIGWYAGLGLTISPSPQWRNISLTLNTLLTEKGYTQWLGQKNIFKFRYFSNQALVNYYVSPVLTVTAGVDISILMGTNVYRGLETYNNLDAGLLVGLKLFDSKAIAVNMQLVYGLVPMLHYYHIDALGNFTSTIHDLRNTCLSMGLRYRIIKR
jgi:hypothetical protein